MAPRPYPGEAISSWVHRIAARYDIGADDLVRHMLGWRSFSFGRAERLDHRADAQLEDALAMATRVDAATIKRLRIVRHDGSATSWHRATPAWCPACLRHDLVARGEVYERAIWRQGACVLCPDHGVALVNTCRWCVAEAPYRFYGTKGRLRLACSACGLPAEPASNSTARLSDPDLGAFGLCMAVPVRRVVRDLQEDLQAALSASPSLPRQTWGLVRSAWGLLAAVGDLTLSIILAARLKVERRVDLLEREPYSPTVGPITPAVLPCRMAFGVLARVAGVLRTLGRDGDAGQRWRPDHGTDLTSAASFLAWLPVDQRGLLAGLAAGWEQPAGHALQATIAQLETGL